MKTKYETPAIEVLKLRVEDVIVTSTYTGPTLGVEDEYTGTSGGTGKWGDLFG